MTIGIIARITHLVVTKVQNMSCVPSVLKPSETVNSLYGVARGMAIPFGSTLEFLDLEHVPVRINIIMICGLTERCVDSDDEHAVVHATVFVPQTLPCEILMTVANGSEKLCPMIIQFIERMITVGHLAHTCIRNIDDFRPEVTLVQILAAVGALPYTASTIMAVDVVAANITDRTIVSRSSLESPQSTMNTGGEQFISTSSTFVAHALLD